MRKIIAVLVAAALLGTLCACEDKPADSESVGELTVPAVTEAAPEPEPEVATEPPFRELTEDDFEHVDMLLDNTDAAPPLDIHEADLSGLDFGARLSPCKAEDVYENYVENTYVDGEWIAQYNAKLEECLSTPCRGMLEKAEFADGKCYMLVNYDNLCGSHDWSIFSYDIGTGDLKELVRHSGIDDVPKCLTLSYAHGRLYYDSVYHVDEDGNKVEISFKADSNGSGYAAFGSSEAQGLKNMSELYSVDVESGEEVKECTVEGVAILGNETEKGLVVQRFADDDTTYYQEFNVTTKELGECDDSVHTPVSGVRFYCDGVPAEVTGGYVDGKYENVVIKTQYYTIQTDLINFDNAFLWKDRACIVSTEYVGTQNLYTYDLTTGERLKMRCDGFSYSNTIQLEDGLLMVNATLDGFSNTLGERIEYVEPTLGMIFRMQSGTHFLFGNIDDAVYYIALSGEPDNYAGNYGFYSSPEQGVPDKLYWFRTKK